MKHLSNTGESDCCVLLNERNSDDVVPCILSVLSATVIVPRSVALRVTITPKPTPFPMEPHEI